jgi:hypothetical protein
MKKSKNLLMASAICFALSGVHLFAMDDAIDDAIDDEGHEEKVLESTASNRPDGDDPDGARILAGGFIHPDGNDPDGTQIQADGSIQFHSGKSTCPGLDPIIHVPAEDLPKFKASQNKEEVILNQLESILEEMSNFVMSKPLTERGHLTPEEARKQNYFDLGAMREPLQSLLYEIVNDPDDETRTKKTKFFMCCVLMIRQYWNAMAYYNWNGDWDKKWPHNTKLNTHFAFLKALIGPGTSPTDMLNFQSLLEYMAPELELNQQEIQSLHDNFKKNMEGLNVIRNSKHLRTSFLQTLHMAHTISDDMFEFCFASLRKLRRECIYTINHQFTLMTLIEEIVAYGQIDMLKKLLDSGLISVEDLERDTINPLLWYTLTTHMRDNQAHKIEMLKFLLDQGIDSNIKIIRSPDYCRPEFQEWEYVLHFAILQWNCLVRFGNTDIIQLLIDHGADLNARDHNGRTPLDMAREIGNQELIQILARAQQQQQENQEIEAFFAGRIDLVNPGAADDNPFRLFPSYTSFL